MQGGPLDQLIKRLSSLPGLGNRSARRIALHLLNRKDTLMLPLAEDLQQAAEKIRECEQCGNLDMRDPCSLCSDARRDISQICVVAHVSDLWAIERTSSYKGLYHVLGGVLSALDGIGPEQLNLRPLESRAALPETQEIILALSATVDGQSTAHYVADRIAREGLRITHLAHGVPVGGELDYLDDGTIVTALKSRKVAG
ncbi:MAG: recombination mediator RecR [Alphaproteobacteria bacterium]|nr:recombination protein RecR [Alphaproteobacteria bacterium]